MGKKRNSKISKKYDEDYLVKIISVQISICLIMFVLVFLGSKFGGDNFGLALDEYKKITKEDMYASKIKDALFKTEKDENEDGDKSENESESKNQDEAQAKDADFSLLLDDDDLQDPLSMNNIDSNKANLSPLSQTPSKGQNSYDILQASIQKGPCLPIENSRITSGFGYRVHPIGKEEKLHAGTDFGANVGDFVRATLNGEVKTASFSEARGYYIVLKHSSKLETYYCHNSKLLVEEGTIVRAGETIALAGSTGDSTGPHVHFEVHINGTPQDPMKTIFADFKFS